MVDREETSALDHLVLFAEIVNGDLQHLDHLLTVVEHSPEDTSAHTPFVLAKSHTHIQQFNLLLGLKSSLVLIELKSKQDRKGQAGDQQDSSPGTAHPVRHGLLLQAEGTRTGLGRTVSGILGKAFATVGPHQKN